MLLRLVALFTIIPLVELYLLLWMGSVVGFWPTVGIVLVTATIGGWLAKREGLRVWNEWHKALAEMRMPEDGIISGLLVLIGGVLLITPGVLTDITGLSLLFPPTRRVLAKWLEGYAERRFKGGPSVMNVRVVSPQGAYARRRVVDVDGTVLEEREVVQTPDGRRAEIRGGVIATDVGRARPELQRDVLEGEILEGTRAPDDDAEDASDEPLEGEVLDARGRRIR